MQSKSLSIVNLSAPTHSQSLVILSFSTEQRRRHVPLPCPLTIRKVFYLEDVFASGQRELNSQLCESLMGRFVKPLLLGDWLTGRTGAMFPQVLTLVLAVL